MLNTFILILALVLIVMIMLQAKGSGLSIVPGSNDFGKFERRGPEKILHYTTIGMVALFILTAMISYFIA